MRDSGEQRQTAWSVGGDIVVADRQLAPLAADRLSAFYADALGAARRSRDPEAAAYLGRQLQQLATAQAAAARWRRAAGPVFGGSASRALMFSKS